MSTLVALMRWGDRWLVGSAPPMLLCGPQNAPLEPMASEADSAAADTRDVDVFPVPGADAQTTAFPQERLG